VAYCAALCDRPARSLEHRMTIPALHSTAQRVQVLAAEAAELQSEIGRLVRAVAPWLLELPGMGGAAARRPHNPRLCRPAAGRGQEPTRDSAVRETGDRPAPVQAAATLRPP
jgi:hypothetical protein